MTADQARLVAVRQWFETDGETCASHAPIAEPPSDQTPLPAGGDILLITGPSGSGKTTLLRQLRAANRAAFTRRRWIDVSRIRLPDAAVVNCLIKTELQVALRRLAEVGLAEAGTLLKKPQFLSEGQQFRLRVAMAIDLASRAKKPCLLVCDEFAAHLDDVTAAVVSLAVRRMCDQQSDVSWIVAAGRELLAQALSPDRIARCDFGKIDISPSAGPRQ